MDKSLFDSDVDPKRIKAVADGLRRQGEFESARMLDSYVHILEARERRCDLATVRAELLRLADENARLLAANRDCVDHFEQMKAELTARKAEKQE